jgi:FAD synthase
VEQILVEKMNTHCLVVGYDHRFGKNREGGFEYLQNCADKFGFEIEKLEVLLVDEAHVSSTHIREALEKGDVTLANKFLGYRYTLHGTVVEGQSALAGNWDSPLPISKLPTRINLFPVTEFMLWKCCFQEKNTVEC